MNWMRASKGGFLGLDGAYGSKIDIKIQIFEEERMEHGGYVEW